MNKIIANIIAGTCGMDTTLKVALAAIEGGAFGLEIAIPFSDPVAGSPAAERANLRALEGGTTPDDVFDMIRSLRRTSDIPVILQTYVNPMFLYGYDEFFKACADCAIAGVAVLDMPFEEREEIMPYCIKHGIEPIFTVFPSRTAVKTAAQAKGFIYLPIPDEKTTAAVRSVTSAQIITDISSGNADAYIVGEKITELTEKYGADAPKYVASYIKECVEE